MSSLDVNEAIHKVRAVAGMSIFGGLSLSSAFLAATGFLPAAITAAVGADVAYAFYKDFRDGGTIYTQDHHQSWTAAIIGGPGPD